MNQNRIKDRPYNLKNRSGDRYGKLVVIDFSETKTIKNNRKRQFWECLCDCGKKCFVDSVHLQSGGTKSCGCLKLNFNKKPKGHSALIEFYNNYKSGAKHRGIEFNLSIELFKNITSMNCFYCDSEPNKAYIHKRRNMSKESIDHATYVGNGIDRQNNLVGYIGSNCVPCCEYCNRMKLKKTFEEFLGQCRKIVNNHEKT